MAEEGGAEAERSIEMWKIKKASTERKWRGRRGRRPGKQGLWLPPWTRRAPPAALRSAPGGCEEAQTHRAPGVPSGACSDASESPAAADPRTGGCARERDVHDLAHHAPARPGACAVPRWARWAQLDWWPALTRRHADFARGQDACGRVRHRVEHQEQSEPAGTPPA